MGMLRGRIAILNSVRVGLTYKVWILRKINGELSQPKPVPQYPHLIQWIQLNSMDGILAIDALLSTFGVHHIFSTGSSGCQRQHTEWRAVQ